jgi:hypothetical protein
MGMFAVLVVVSVVLAQGQQPASRPTPPPGPAQPASGPRLEVTPPELDLGEVWHGQDPVGTIMLKNVGDAPLKIVRIRTGCRCTQVTKPKSPLLPGESDILSVKYKTFGYQRKGEISRAVKISTNDPQQQVTTVKLTGMVKEVVETSPTDSILFGQMTCDERITKSIELTVVYDEPLFLKLKKPDEQSKPPGWDAYELKLEALEPGVKYRLTATTKPPLEPGVALLNVPLETGATEIPEVTVRVHGIVQARVSISSSRLYVPVSLNRPTQRIIRVNYLTSHPVQITKIESDHPQITGELRPPRAGSPGNASSTAAGNQSPAGTQPVSSAPSRARFSSHEILVSLPPGGDLPEGGAKLFISTDDPDPRYSKLEVLVTNERPERKPRRPAR